MYKFLIKKYVSKLSQNDINKFALENGVSLSKDELVLIEKYIKKYWETLIYGDYNKIFLEVKPFLKDDTYNKMLELYNFYKEQYKNYL